LVQFEDLSALALYLNRKLHLVSPYRSLRFLFEFVERLDPCFGFGSPCFGLAPHPFQFLAEQIPAFEHGLLVDGLPLRLFLQELTVVSSVVDRTSVEE